MNCDRCGVDVIDATLVGLTFDGPLLCLTCLEDFGPSRLRRKALGPRPSTRPHPIRRRGRR
jgi:hypothetical protein